MARAINTSIFVKNGPNYAGIGVGGEGLDQLDHRVAHGRGPHHLPHLHPRASLHAQGRSFSSRCSAASGEAAAASAATRVACQVGARSAA
jgi:hypothetical protein